MNRDKGLARAFCGEHSLQDRQSHLILSDKVLEEASQLQDRKEVLESTSKTATAAARNSRPSLSLFSLSTPLYSPCKASSTRTSSADAGSRRSHSSPFVSGTGQYGVSTNSESGKLRLEGRSLRACGTSCQSIKLE
jgi:hypothetical protein